MTDPSRLPAHVSVFIVGAGFGGLGAAIKLQEAGERDFLCVDRGSEVGGTWRDNTYPGAACDVPSQLYSFSFALNPNWSHSFSRQPQIQQYLRDVADRADVLDRFRFNVRFESAAWDDDAEQWRIETSAGPTTANVLVAAAGALSDPKMPAIEGIDTFAGEVFHSAQWNHDLDLTGKRVGVIGTGASAIQIVPELAPQVAQLDVYQRTAPWVMPRRDRPYKPWEKQLMRTDAVGATGRPLAHLLSARGHGADVHRRPGHRPDRQPGRHRPTSTRRSRIRSCGPRSRHTSRWAASAC